MKERDLEKMIISNQEYCIQLKEMSNFQIKRNFRQLNTFSLIERCLGLYDFEEQSVLLDSDILQAFHAVKT